MIQQKKEEMFMSKKLILFLMLSILIIGCSSYSQNTPSQPTKAPPNPNVGGGCSVSSPQEENTQVIKIPIARAL